MNTAHPIDTEALAKRAGHVLFTEGPEQPAATAREVCVLLDLLAAAEARATRAEAQSAIRVRTIAYARKRAREADARIKAVRDVLDDGTWTGLSSGKDWVSATAIRHALEG